MSFVQTKVDSLPLGDFSTFIVNKLPEFNKGENLNGLLEGLNLLPNNDFITYLCENTNTNVQILAMGDLGMFLVSCLKLGIPKENLHLVYKYLKELSLSTGIVPRDTYASYVTFNPQNNLRTFTGDKSEVGFIEQHKRSDLAIEPAAQNAFLIQKNEVNIDNVHNILLEIEKSLVVLKGENKSVNEKVDPVFFICSFRSYFFPIEIDKTYYNAPSGVHIPSIILLDICFGVADEKYNEEVEELLPYLLEADRLMIKQAMHIPSIKRRIEKGDSQYKKTEILHSVKRIYKKLRLYRIVHQGLVTRYIRNQDKEITEGTGGFPFDEFLQRRIDNVEKSESEMKTIIEKE